MVRLLSKDGICTYLGGISAATYDAWHGKGIVPGPVPGTTRYDIRAHDACLDRISGLDSPRKPSSGFDLDEWERSHAA